MPECEPEDIKNGRRYLQSRGIDLGTILEAEKAGFLGYNKFGVLFIGRDKNGVPQNITRRDIRSDEELARKGEGFRPKKDFNGSSKYFPQIFPGNTTEVWVVEGGMDALAVHDGRKRYDETIPTMIVSGGARNKSFLENPHVQEILKTAKLIQVAFEKEKNAEIQKQTDNAHLEQCYRIREIVSSETKIGIHRPSVGKDPAEDNLLDKQMDQDLTLGPHRICGSNLFHSSSSGPFLGGGAKRALISYDLKINRYNSIVKNFGSGGLPDKRRKC